MSTIRVNCQTGEQSIVPLTQAEIDDAAARTAAELNDPVRLQAVVDTDAKDSAKVDVVIQYLVSHTPDECYAKVQADVTDLASAKVMLGRFAKALSVLARGQLR